MSPPCWRSYMFVSMSRTIGYEISPTVSANSGIGPTLIIWWTTGVSGMQAPAIRARRGLQTPQQITQMSVSMSPGRRAHAAHASGASETSSIPRTSVFARTSSAPICVPARA